MNDYHSTIRIEIDDPSKMMRITWPNGMVHSYHLSPPQNEHGIVNRIADEINRITMVPQLCDVQSGAGGGQYDFKRLNALLDSNSYGLYRNGANWVVEDSAHGIVGIFKNMSDLLDELGEDYK
jgi:hypothetical protein